MDKSTHEEHLSQPLQTNNIQFKLAVIFLTGYNGRFNVTNKNKKYNFIKSMTDKNGYIQIQLPNGAYKLVNLNIKIKKIIIEEEHYTESNYPFTIQPNFSTLESIIEMSTQGPVITFVPDDSPRDLFEFNKTTI